MAKTTSYNINSAKRFTTYEQYSGGINASDDETVIDEIELSPNTTNIELTPRGIIRKRHGLKSIPFVAHGAGFNYECVGLYHYIREGKRFFIRVPWNNLNTNDVYYLNRIDEEGNVVSVIYNNPDNPDDPKNGQAQNLVKPPVQFIEDNNSSKIYIIDQENIYVYDHETIKVSELLPRKVTPFEAKTFGFNMLSDNPLSLIAAPETSIAPINWGIVADQMEIHLGDTVLFTCYTSGVPEPRYYFEYQLIDKETRQPIEDWKKLNRELYSDVPDGKAPDYTLENTRTFFVSSLHDIKIRATMWANGEFHEYVASYTVSEGIDTQENPTSLIKKCTKGFLYNNRLWLYGNPDFPHMLFFSEIDDFTYFPTYNYILLSNTVNNGIVSHVFFKEKVVLFLDRGLKSLNGYDPTDFVVRTINEYISIVDSRACTNIQDYVVFAGHDGIWFLYNDRMSIDPNANLVKIDSKVETVIDRKKITEVFSVGDYVYFNTSTGTVWKYDIKHRIWLKDLYFTPIRNIQTYGNTFYCTYNIGTHILELDYEDENEGTDFIYVNWDTNTVPFEVVIESKRFSMNQLFNLKKIKEIQFFLKYDPDIVKELHFKRYPLPIITTSEAIELDYANALSFDHILVDKITSGGERILNPKVVLTEAGQPKASVIAFNIELPPSVEGHLYQIQYSTLDYQYYFEHYVDETLVEKRVIRPQGKLEVALTKFPLLDANKQPINNEMKVEFQTENILTLGNHSTSILVLTDADTYDVEITRPVQFNLDLYIGGRFLSAEQGITYQNSAGESDYTSERANGYDVLLTSNMIFGNIVVGDEEKSKFDPDNKIIKRFKIPSTKSNDVQFIMRNQVEGKFELLAHGFVYQVKKATTGKIIRI